jgi:biopolymer transport protein ExbD
MNFKPQRNDEVNLDITPLIDVVFLLLIFFMVSTTFEHNSEINITLPEATEELSEAKPDAVNIGIDAQGNIYINERPLLNTQLKTIMDAISEAVVGLDEPPVIISADAQASHQSVIKVMDAARQIGLIRITFATMRIEEE